MHVLRQAVITYMIVFLSLYIYFICIYCFSEDVWKWFCFMLIISLFILWILWKLPSLTCLFFWTLHRCRFVLDCIFIILTLHFWKTPWLHVGGCMKVMLIFLQNMSLLLSKTAPTDIRNHVLPMIARALEANQQQIQVQVHQSYLFFLLVSFQH